MKFIKFFALALMIVCLTSCGSKNKDGIYDVTVDNTVIGGKLSQYFTLVDKTYKYKVDYGLIDEISVELKCIAPLPENLKAYIGIEVLDEDEVTISVDAPDENSCDATDVLRQATPGQTVSINIKNFESVEKQIPAKIRLSSLVEEEKAEETDSEEAADEAPSFDISNITLPSEIENDVEIIRASKAVSKYGSPTIKIIFKLLNTVNTSSMCSPAGQMWIVGHAYDEEGIEMESLQQDTKYIKEWRTEDSYGRDYKEFLESEPGETITLTFTGGGKNSNNVAADLNKVANFKLKIKND